MSDPRTIKNILNVPKKKINLGVMLGTCENQGEEIKFTFNVPFVTFIHYLLQNGWKIDHTNGIGDQVWNVIFGGKQPYMFVDSIEDKPEYVIVGIKTPTLSLFKKLFKYKTK